MVLRWALRKVPRSALPLAVQTAVRLVALKVVPSVVQMVAQLVALLAVQSAAQSVVLSAPQLEYWSVFQMLTHHASGGCNFQPGDFYGSGTISGTEKDQLGSLLEASVGGMQEITFPTGETRTFLEDGDEVVMRAWCDKDGAARIGFGECRSIILPADGGTA